MAKDSKYFTRRRRDVAAETGALKISFILSTSNNADDFVWFSSGVVLKAGGDMNGGFNP